MKLLLLVFRDVEFQLLPFSFVMHGARDTCRILLLNNLNNFQVNNSI